MASTSKKMLHPDKWLEAHGDYLYRYALSKTGQPEVAQDIVQETLLAAWRGREEYKGKAHERSWLLSICRNKTTDYYRQANQNEVSLPSDATEAMTEDAFFNQDGSWKNPSSVWVNDPLQDAEAAAFWDSLQHCVSRLSDQQREAFVLNTLSGLGAAEAGDLLGTTTNHLYVLIHRAKLNLARCLSAIWFVKEDAP